MVNTNAEKAAKGHVHIQDTPTDLLDQQPLDRANLSAQLVESRLGKFGQRDKWSFCLTAARMAAEQEKR
jgi:hypothetical protein